MNVFSLRKIKKFSNLRSGIWLVLRSEVCLALKRVNHATRNEWRYVDVVDATYVSIVRFCENVGIDEYFLRAMPSFCQNVGIECDFL